MTDFIRTGMREKCHVRFVLSQTVPTNRDVSKNLGWLRTPCAGLFVRHNSYTKVLRWVESIRSALSPMVSKLEQLQRGTLVKGILPEENVTIIDVSWHGSDVAEVTYKSSSGRLGSELLYRDNEGSLEIVRGYKPWTFDADGSRFRLVSEALRIKLAYFFDLVLAVHTSMIDPLPHQITSVYEKMLPVNP